MHTEEQIYLTQGAPESNNEDWFGLLGFMAYQSL